MPRELFDRKYWTTVLALAFAEFKMRDQGTYLGFIWTLLNPFVYFIVLYNLFVKWMGTHIPDFPVYLIIGIVQWNFFSSATSNAINSITGHSTYIKSINMEKSALVVSSILTVLFSHLLELVILLVFCFIVKGQLTIMVLLLIPILLLNIYIVCSISFILATIGVYFLDVSRIWGILMNVGMFLTPIFYTLSLLSPARRNIILLNPMTHIIQASRDVLIGGTFPALTGLLYVFAAATVVFFAGYRYFKSREGYFIEKL